MGNLFNLWVAMGAKSGETSDQQQKGGGGADTPAVLIGVSCMWIGYILSCVMTTIGFAPFSQEPGQPKFVATKPGKTFDTYYGAPSIRAGPLGFMVEYPALFAGSLGYLAVVTILPKYVTKDYSKALRPVMVVYNIVQIVVCTYMTLGLWREMHISENMDRSQPYKALFALDHEYTEGLEHFIFVHYLSKYLDFCDTIFIILKQKHVQKTFLHIYHHSTIGFIWGWLLKNGHGNGTAAYGALINSFVHVLLYSHYLITSQGWNNPLKNYLTRFQIAQFFTCVCHAIIVSFTDMDKMIPKGFAHVQFGYHITMITLFSALLAYNTRKSKKA